jgi:hypothetical protein
MATVPKTLTYDESALAAGQAAAEAMGMTLSAYASRALRKQAMADNIARAAVELAALPDDRERAAIDALRAARVARIVASGDAA